MKEELNKIIVRLTMLEHQLNDEFKRQLKNKDPITWTSFSQRIRNELKHPDLTYLKQLILIHLEMMVLQVGKIIFTYKGYGNYKHYRKEFIKNYISLGGDSKQLSEGLSQFQILQINLKRAMKGFR